MSELPKDDRIPRLQVNRAGLHAVIATAVIIGLGLLAALLAQAGLFSANPGAPHHPEGLTTLALVLAILAFLVQILVFVFQTQTAGNSERRAEKVNSQTLAALDKVESSNRTTQTVLLSQFERLLDFVVDGRRGFSTPVRAIDVDDDSTGGGSGQQELDDEPLTRADLQEALKEAGQPPDRPTFQVPPRPEPSPEDQRVLGYLRSWPDRDEAERMVAEILTLPPLPLAMLTRFGVWEAYQRRTGILAGLTGEGDPPPAVRDLIDRGLVILDKNRAFLSEHGRSVVRMLPLPKVPKMEPAWLDEVRAPLMSRPEEHAG